MDDFSFFDYPTGADLLSAQGSTYDPYLSSVLNIANQPVGSGVMQIAGGPQYDPNAFMGPPQAPAGSRGGNAGASSWLSGLAKILTGAGGFLGGLGPGLAGAANLAAQALQPKPYHTPPYVTAPAPRTEGGVTKPLNLGGDAPMPSRDPMTDYVALMRSLR